MTITREQVQDLRPGDVVEIRLDDWDSGQAIRGPLTPSDTFPGVLEVRIPGGDGRYWGRSDNGHPVDPDHRTLTVVSRAPRPLYVNHDRPEPVPGDVVRDEDSDDPRTWTRNAKGFSYEWLNSVSHDYEPREKLPARLRLLVDGETGQVVP